MTKRILLALLTLIIAVLVAGVIPLGFKAAAYERRAYVDDARAVARAASSVAEEQLADHRASPDMGRVLAVARRDGDTLLITDVRGGSVASAGSAASVVRGLVDDAVTRDKIEQDVARGYVSVVVPVRDGEKVVGAVTLVRPLGPLDARVRALWFTLALIAAAAIVASAVLALALARWVSRPLAELDASARRLGAGDLAARAPAGTGPPELRRLAVNFNAMAARLETLVHGHRATVADVSHQLRTPLAALRLRLDLLAADADPATAAELVGALDEFTRLSRLVDGLLAVARAESTVPRPVQVDVGDVIRERVAAWQPVADDRQVRLACDVTGPITVALGEGHLEQILDNLIANALDATSAGNHITLFAGGVPEGSPRAPAASRGGAVGDGVVAGDGSDRVWPADGTVPTGAGTVRNAGGAVRAGSASMARAGAGRVVRIVVADDGPGMSPNDRFRAFGRFTSTSPGGTGLGLAIVHRLVTSNRGTAALEETPGGGLSVVIEFPATPGSSRDPPGTAADAGTPPVHGR